MVTPKMSRKALENMKPVVAEVVPFECPFREFRDNELQIDTWGLGPAAFRAHYYVVKAAVKTSHEPPIWIDDQTQPLPRSAQHFLHGWIRAEDLAEARWNAEVLIFEDNDGGKMAISDIQLSHTQVLFRSSFCREVLSACFILERVESLAIEHQWEMFSCSFGQEGWRPKYHIYSPGTKPGGGTQHKPTLSKNGCYLVRLFYLGAWRCVWVNDYVPVDSNGAPLLPFSPLMTHPPGKPGSKHVPPAVTASVIYLWPLLLTKALLKLAAPDGNSDDSDGVVDEQLKGFDIMHALTGCVNISYPMSSAEDLWTRITSEVPLFSWDDDDETQPSTIKSRSTKKSTAKELANVVRRNSLTYIDLVDTKDCPPYQLPGITPGHEMNLLVTMARDLPLKKPLPEPEVALWKYYRWVDWAKRHGLYAMYACPRTRFLKVNGLMKLSYAPHLLDVQSTESITYGFIEEHGMEDTSDNKKKKDRKTKDQTKSAMNAAAALQVQQMKEELREWVQFMELQSLVKCLHVLFYPSMFNFASAGSNPPMRLPTAKGAVPKATDITAPKGAPLYFQLDGPEVNKIKISLSSLHPRVLANCGSRIPDYVEKSYVVLEKFEWFNDAELPVPSGFATTRRYQSLELDYPPGRHYFRVWVHARVNWSLMVISESTLLLGTKDVIQGAAVRDCPWASKFLSNLGLAFLNWTKVVRSTQNVMIQADREFFSSYAPDLPWDKKVVGYDPHLRHWMFRQALQSRLQKSLGQTEWKQVVSVLRKYFCDPNFGFTEKPRPVKSLRNIADLEVCDCVMPEVEETEIYEEQHLEETEMVAEDEKPLVDSTMMAQLLTYPEPPITSQVCELATDQLQCGLLKEEREKVISRHEAAIAIQAHWRGTWARKCLNSTATFTPEILKYVQDQAFGTVDSLSMLMNEFFTMFPGAKYAYSVSSALSGVYGFQQHTGTTPVFPKCVWVPYFQGVFYCHAPVKVHFDVHSNLGHSMLAVYDNDTSAQLPQAFNSHITYDFNPNVFG
ncbi:unnamed protein product [Spodoptera exigua]|nr:unnamed protein product [Spodoptera exigua]